MGWPFPLGVANTLGRPRLRSDGSRAAERGRSYLDAPDGHAAPMPTLGVLLRARCWPPHAALRSSFQSSARGRDRAKRDPVSSAMHRIRPAYTSPCRLLSVAATSRTLARLASARMASSVAGAHPPPVLT